jgi:outer membrane biosynthesis protein TonB
MDEREAEKQKFEEQERALRDEIAKSGAELDKLEAELDGVEGRIRALGDEGPKYEALTRVLQSFESLEEAGAAELFWGDDSAGGQRLTHAREQIDAFEANMASLQAERESLAERVGKQNLVLEHLDYSLADAIAEEESRRAEWLVEREQDEASFARSTVMPWSRGYEEDRRFRNSIAASALLALVLGMAIPFIDLPLPERAKLTKLPDRVAKLVELNRPKPVEVAEVIEPEPIEPEPEEPQEELVADEPVPELSETPAPQVAEAQPETRKESVKSKGILAFRESFADRASQRTRNELGSRASFNNAGAEAVGRPTRAMVTTNAAGSSGGINLASISRDVGGGGAGDGIGGVAVTQVSSSIGGNGTSDRPLAGGPSAGRTDEEIQIVFDRYKAALYRLYNRELRKDPTLRGQLVLRLTIEPDGSVSFCELQSSDMDAPTLASQIVDRVKGFDFGAKEDILAVTIVYPIDFLPAA